MPSYSAILFPIPVRDRSISSPPSQNGDRILIILIFLQRSCQITSIHANRPLAGLIVNVEQAMVRPFVLVFQLTWAHLQVVDLSVQLARIARQVLLARITSASIRVLTRAVRARHAES